MQLVGLAPARPPPPPTRQASIKPPPNRGPSPSFRQTRRVVDSQFRWIIAGLALIFEDEFGRIEQRPQQILDRRSAVGPRLGKQGLADLPLLGVRHPAEGEEVKF